VEARCSARCRRSNEAQWLAEFEKYKQIPQYSLVNAGMSLDEFKVIYWWEWGHRLLGRVIGLAFVIPLLGFWAAGRIDRVLAPRLLALLALGAAQGVLGWYMVMSGLVDRVSVSQYRLAAHLTLAIVIFAAIVWVALGIGRDAGQGDGDARRAGGAGAARARPGADRGGRLRRGACAPAWATTPGR
jgi:heme a synthase